MNTTTTIDAAEYMEPENMTEQSESELEEFENLMERLTGGLDYDDLEMEIVLKLFKRLFSTKKDENVRQCSIRYKAFCADRFRCDENSLMAYLFAGFAFGVRVGLNFASKIKNM